MYHNSTNLRRSIRRSILMQKKPPGLILQPESLSELDNNDLNTPLYPSGHKEIKSQTSIVETIFGKIEKVKGFEKVGSKLQSLYAIDEDLVEMPAFTFEGDYNPKKIELEKSRKLWSNIANSILTPFTPHHKTIQRHILKNEIATEGQSSIPKKIENSKKEKNKKKLHVKVDRTANFDKKGKAKSPTKNTDPGHRRVNSYNELSKNDLLEKKKVKKPMARTPAPMTISFLQTPREKADKKNNSFVIFPDVNSPNTLIRKGLKKVRRKSCICKYCGVQNKKIKKMEQLFPLGEIKQTFDKILPTKAHEDDVPKTSERNRLVSIGSKKKLDNIEENNQPHLNVIAISHKKKMKDSASLFKPVLEKKPSIELTIDQKSALNKSGVIAENTGNNQHLDNNHSSQELKEEKGKIHRSSVKKNSKTNMLKILEPSSSNKKDSAIFSEFELPEPTENNPSLSDIDNSALLNPAGKIMGHRKFQKSATHKLSVTKPNDSPTSHGHLVFESSRREPNYEEDMNRLSPMNNLSKPRSSLKPINPMLDSLYHLSPRHNSLISALLSTKKDESPRIRGSYLSGFLKQNREAEKSRQELWKGDFEEIREEEDQKIDKARKKFRGYTLKNLYTPTKVENNSMNLIPVISKTAAEPICETDGRRMTLPSISSSTHTIANDVKDEDILRYVKTQERRIRQESNIKLLKIVGSDDGFKGMKKAYLTRMIITTPNKSSSTKDEKKQKKAKDNNKTERPALSHRITPIPEKNLIKILETERPDLYKKFFQQEVQMEEGNNFQSFNQSETKSKMKTSKMKYSPATSLYFSSSKK